MAHKITREELMRLLAEISQFLENQYHFERELIQALQEQNAKTEETLHNLSTFFCAQETFTPALDLYKTGYEAPQGESGTKKIFRNRGIPGDGAGADVDPVKYFQKIPPSASSVLERKVFDGNNRLVATIRYDQVTVEIIFATHTLTREHFNSKAWQRTFLKLSEDSPNLEADIEPKDGSYIRMITLRGISDISGLDFIESAIQELLL